jgi:hypothetical protein
MIAAALGIAVKEPAKGGARRALFKSCPALGGAGRGVKARV